MQHILPPLPDLHLQPGHLAIGGYETMRDCEPFLSIYSLISTKLFSLYLYS